MPQTPKNKPEVEEPKDEESDALTWDADQKRREYYYDDAHGYEVYKPEDENEDAD